MVASRDVWRARWPFWVCASQLSGRFTASGKVGDSYGGSRLKNNDIVPGFDETNQSLTITLEVLPEEPDFLVMHLKGYALSHVFFGKQMRKVLQSQYRRIVVDCARLLNESGDGIIPGVLSAKRELGKAGGDIVLANVNVKYAEVLNLLHVNVLVALTATVGEAFTLLKGHAPRSASENSN
jgi:hypothetical protein